MEAKHLESFPPGVATQLKTYVYRLIDPRNGETFYIGKGEGDRVFAHSRADLDGDENEDESTMTLSDKVMDRAGIMRFGRPHTLSGDHGVPSNGIEA